MAFNKHLPSETSSLECVQDQWVNNVVHANGLSDGKDTKAKSSRTLQNQYDSVQGI